MDGLKASCECIDDLMINLFKFYQVASDRELVRYIKTKQYQYDYGYNISTSELMTSTKKLKIYARTPSGNLCPQNNSR